MIILDWVIVAGISKPSHGTLPPKTRSFRNLKFHFSTDHFNIDYPQKDIISCLFCCKFTEVEKFISAVCCRAAAKM